jgi:hypothetical protein
MTTKHKEGSKSGGGRQAPLDKRLNASSGKEETSMAQWNMAELKANLEGDTKMLEETLRAANKRLGEQAGVQLVEVGGRVGDDGKRVLREGGGDSSQLQAELNRIKTGSWATDLTIKGVGREPTVVPPPPVEASARRCGARALPR